MYNIHIGIHMDIHMRTKSSLLLLSTLAIALATTTRACEVGKWRGDSTATCYNCPAGFRCDGLDPFPVPCPPDTRALESSGICCPKKDHGCGELAVDNHSMNCACVSLQCPPGKILMKTSESPSSLVLECADVVGGCKPCLLDVGTTTMMMQDENCMCYRIPHCAGSFWKYGGDKFSCLYS